MVFLPNVLTAIRIAQIKLLALDKWATNLVPENLGGFISSICNVGPDHVSFATSFVAVRGDGEGRW